MRYLNFTSNRALREGENEGGTGGGGGDNPANAGGNSGENNIENDVANFDKMWEPKPSENGDNGDNNNSDNNNDGGNASEALANHIESLRLTEGIDMVEIGKGIAEGNYDSLNSAFSQLSANVYERAIMDSNRLVEAKVKTAVEDAVNQATGKTNANLAVRELNDALPFTKMPAFAPVAKAVFNQMMGEHDNDTAKAIESTRAYFKQSAELSAKDLGIQTAPSTGPGSNGFGKGSVNSGNDAGEETDWMAALTGS